MTMKTSPRGPLVEWNGEELSVPGSKEGTVIERVGNFVTITSPLKYQLQWDGEESIFLTVCGYGRFLYFYFYLFIIL